MRERSEKARILEKVARRAIIPKGSVMTEVILDYRRYRGKRHQYRLPLFQKLQQNVEPVFSHDLQLFYMNVETGSDKLIIYLHGGAYVSEILPFHWIMLDKLTRQIDDTFIIPDYPLAPFSNYRECYDRLTVFYKKCLEYYRDRRIILMGDSAGGGLALGLAMYWHAAGLPVPEKMILLSPWVDLIMDNPDIENYLSVDPTLKRSELSIDAAFWADGTDLHDYRLSPLYGDLSVIRDVTMFTGTHEIFYPDIVKTHEKLLAAGVKSELVVGYQLNHVYPAFPIPEADEAINHIADIIRDL